MLFNINKNNQYATIGKTGGKGYSLIEMYKAGISVPSGLIISTGVYKDFIKDKVISKNLNLLKNRRTQEKAIDIITSRIIYLNFKNKFKAEFAKKIEEYDVEFFSVRSSANVEDSNKKSFAGEFDSFLFVKKKNILKEVKKCYASVFSDRIMQYIKNPSDILHINMAIVVQEMIPGDVSGICFTANPLDNKKNDVIIEAVHGLGEYLAQGLITPDRYIIQRTTHVPIEVSFYEQEKMLVAKKGGGIKEIENHNKKTQKLTGKEMIKLAKIAEKIEKLHNIPCDIEWTYYNKNLYILQSRPIVFIN